MSDIDRNGDGRIDDADCVVIIASVEPAGQTPPQSQPSPCALLYPQALAATAFGFLMLRLMQRRRFLR